MPRLSDLLGDQNSKDKLMGMARTNRPPPARAPSRPARRDAGPPAFRGHSAGELMPEFVSLDFETTGLEARDDRVTEVGMVRFVKGQPADRFSSLINPGRSIPPEITELTGISAEMVKDAPPFSEVAEKIVAFIGNAPLCGHQIEFDIEFLGEELKRLGKSPAHSYFLDTAVLARIVLPRLAGYSLGHVARTVEHDLQSAHRALDDALASGSVAVKLLDKLKEIPAYIRLRMIGFAPGSSLKRVLQRSLDGDPLLDNERIRGQRPIPRKLSPPDELAPVDQGEIAAVFAAQGRLAGVMEGFSPRAPQTSMADSVARALNEKSFLAVEAGTGTGKSLAYLIPAAMYALRNEWRVLVSTRTRNLQDQLVTKDLPLVKSVTSADLRFAVLKGRSNYLCKQRFERLVAGTLGNLSPRERMGVLPLIRWAEETATGDIEEQSQFSRASFNKVWNLVSAESHQCLGRGCTCYGECFLQRARQTALGSHIVVINHALFFSEICAESSFLGRIGPIVFDEAHHIESTGYQHLRVEVDTNRINSFLESLMNLQKRLEKHEDGPAGLVKAAKPLKPLLKRVRKDTTAFLAELDAWAAVKQPGVTQYQFAVTDNPFAGCQGPGTVDYVLKEAQDFLSDLRQAIMDCLTGFEELGAEASACADRVSQLKADLQYVSAAVTEEHVFWIEGNHQKGWVKLCGVPLDIGGMLNGIWANNEGGVIFTSATLTIGGSTEYLLPKLGLTGELTRRTVTEILPSPFEGRQMLATAVKTAPDPDTQEYAKFVAQSITTLIKEFGRNTLVLFTANTLLRSVYSLLIGPGGVGKKDVFAQNITGNRHVILEQFRKARASALLGTDSFWEGIDAPGEACEIVVITRLPFPVPTHPLTQAIAHRHEEQHGESFISYSVPEAILRFRQGAGRLIRTHADRGLLLVLDNRIVTRGYGKQFARSLPTTLTSCASMIEVVDAARAFFAGHESVKAAVEEETFDWGA